jgi:hypothetical protein
MDQAMREDWKNLGAVGIIETEQDIQGKVSIERRHFILSRGVKTDEAFAAADMRRAQALADAFSPRCAAPATGSLGAVAVPVLDVFCQAYHWSIRQAEYSTDLMFRSEQILVPLYDAISRQAVLAANAERVSGFLGKKVTPQLAQEIGSRLSTRNEGRCIKHYMGASGVKVYDKFSRVLRVETTVNDLSIFKHHRKVEHRDRHDTRELAPLKKTTYGLIDLRVILLGCKQRYLAFLSSLDDPSAGERDLQRLGQPRVGNDPSVKGLNFFDATDQTLLRPLQSGKFTIHGWRRANLLAYLNITPSAMSRQLRRLHVLGLIKKVTHTYRYYLTRLGRSAIAAACSLTRFNIVPAMAATH